MIPDGPYWSLVGAGTADDLHRHPRVPGPHGHLPASGPAPHSTDRAEIESSFGHINGDWPHLERITDPAALHTELTRVRSAYNTVRLHAGIGYVSPADEHQGRGPAIRPPRRIGLKESTPEPNRLQRGTTSKTAPETSHKRWVVTPGDLYQRVRNTSHHRDP